MKHFIYIALSILALSACRLTDYSEDDGIDTSIINTPSSDGDASNVAELSLAVDVIDLGMITQGEKIDFNLEFTNTGEGPLVLTDVRATCGCTVGKNWPREPIESGGSGNMTISFNSEGKDGHKESTISIVANTRPATTAIVLRADIVAPDMFEEK